ncbi:ATP-dependent bile acid permease [Neolecta irregularis DAH-3]|uniref:ATP-dependent bile acid permease n=1 Tax=Neolecta irregularis (strain DAH-3) TaxID=1198029 RepID=A0A1U7LMP3_NEOID|nr:ATP-dependent bile acid permease [Neolecta irregularis DAH-3]|eukprot:OLL23812.1 ATP-dependent bile acid permease [Neolecta irregularis DAH-3]
MGGLACRGPLWQGQDFSNCFRKNYIFFFFPVLFAGTSLAILLLSNLVCAYKSASKWRYSRISQDDDADADISSDNTLIEDYGDDIIDQIDDQPKLQILITALETLCAVAQVSVFLAAFVIRHCHFNFRLLSQVIVWGYILALVIARLHISRYRTTSSLWIHTTILYLLNWPLAFFALRSTAIRRHETLYLGLSMANLLLNSILALIALTTPGGNSMSKRHSVNGLTPTREPTASLLSLATFSWVDSLVWKGYFQTLNLPDVWDLRYDDRATYVIQKYRKCKQYTSLALTLLQHFDLELLQQAIWASLYSLLTFAPTLLLKQILLYVDNPTFASRGVAWMMIVGLLFSSAASSFANGQALWIGRRICIRLRAIIIGEIYSKALRRRDVAALANSDDDHKMKKNKDEDASPANNGAIINLMAVDAFKVSEICAYLHFLCAGIPLQLIIAIILLYSLLGWSALAGVLTMAVLFPFQYMLTSRFDKIQDNLMSATDKRINRVNEIMQSIRIIKFFAWEDRFVHLVNECRNKELAYLRARFFNWALYGVIWYGTPVLITIASFASYTKLAHRELTAPIAFTALSLFNILQQPLSQLADIVTSVIQSKVSLDRVHTFLQEEETSKYEQLKGNRARVDAQGRPLIGFTNATYTWASQTEVERYGTLHQGATFQLRNLNVRFPSDQLSLVVGPTGSGKTSLLMALLGEMTLLKGSGNLPGLLDREESVPDPLTGVAECVAYCAQQAWLLNDTIKNNILFASPFDEKRYREVIAACALTRDLQILDAGDDTEVGEKGIALSGGQKQRISLARALYSHSRYILLDDCLSAVDSHTAKWIYQYCIKGNLMENRTIILVTHNVSLCLPQADYVVAMRNGAIVGQGEPQEVLMSGVLGDQEEIMPCSSRDPRMPPSQVPSRLPSYNQISDCIEAQEGVKAEALESKKDEERKVNASRLVQDETKAEGSVGWDIYKIYIQAVGGWLFWTILAIGFAIQQGASIAQTFWVREWAAQYKSADIARATFHHGSYAVDSMTMSSNFRIQHNHHFLPGTPQPSHPAEVDINYYLGVYAALAMAYIIVTFIRMGIMFWGSINASVDLYNRLLHSVMGAKIRFFDSTPLGRIMNRFSKDIETVDQELAITALGLLHDMLGTLSVVILISVITPGFLVAGLFITALYAVIGTFYLRASRELKRLESVSRSPIYQHFGETLVGVSTIRAYGDSRRFIKDNLSKIDANNRPFIYLWACNRWLSIRVDIAGAFVCFFSAMFVLLNSDRLDAGLAGLSLTYAITFTDHVLWVVRLYAANEMNFNSVERIREFLDIEQEAPQEIPEKKPSKNWPDKGAISVRNLVLEYASDLPPVIKDISFNVEAGAKVGIVGRTGAGKSTIAAAFFRFLEAKQGTIIIDGVDISEIGLQDLRQRLTIIPQDPTLFTGTIRSNVDPFDSFDDAEIFESLRRVHLIESSPAAMDGQNINIFLNLESPVAEGGGNLSQGQRQLLCLARALLRRSRIVIMDEATASVDHNLDAKIQQTIRSEFASFTIITIAHRLLSIIDYDKIIVLDQGELKEDDHPYRLLQNDDSIFKAQSLALSIFSDMLVYVRTKW